MIISKIKEVSEVCHGTRICVAYLLRNLTASKLIFFREFENQSYFIVVSNAFIQTELRIYHFERLVAF